ncbi:hypothetical protein EVG20_g9463 [Dentipellis fragilis]|uniref:Uncharacterized protein n=1 Tax=Dentipellis fragilis TaxID=205917 RepID=A0A4Y9XY61_9AGAM|nr:hypothetical protein EVG20_g9463 [Dentipellis fragilis]
MPDIATGRRGKTAKPSLGSLIRTFAPGSSVGDRGSSLFSNTFDTRPQAESPMMSDLMSGSTLAVLKDVAEMFDSVPYIKAAAGIVLWIIEIKDEISDLGDKWLEFVEKLNGVVAILRDLRETHKKFKSESELPKDLKHDLYRLATQLQHIRQVLQQYIIHKPAFWDKVSRIIRRAELIKQAEKCSRDLDTCLQGFMMRSLISLRMQAHRDRGVAGRHLAPLESLFSTDLATETFASSIDLGRQFDDPWSSRFVETLTNTPRNSNDHLHLPETIPFSSSSTTLHPPEEAADSRPSGPSSKRPAPSKAFRAHTHQKSRRDTEPVVLGPMPEVAHLGSLGRPSAEPDPLLTRARAEEDDEAVFQRVRAVWGLEPRPDRFQPWYPPMGPPDETPVKREGSSDAQGLSSWRSWLTDPYRDTRYITPPPQTPLPVPDSPQELFGPHWVIPDTDND